VIHAETEDFWVFDKPAGQSVNDTQDTPGFITQQKQALGVKVIHPVHRLDAGTSGLLLAAKNSAANKVLSKAFQNKTVEKVYLAIIRAKLGAKLKRKQGWVIGDMKTSRNGSWMLLRSKDNPAVTYFETASLGERYRLAILSPKTGKTHQLRVALKSNGTPILGDERYGGEEADRLYLHAYHLAFEFNKKMFRYQAAPSSGPQFLSDSFNDLNTRVDTFLSSLPSYA